MKRVARKKVLENRLARYRRAHSRKATAHTEKMLRKANDRAMRELTNG